MKQTWRDVRAAAETLGITAAEFDQAVGANGVDRSRLTGRRRTYTSR